MQIKVFADEQHFCCCADDVRVLMPHPIYDHQLDGHNGFSLRLYYLLFINWSAKQQSDFRFTLFPKKEKKQHEDRKREIKRNSPIYRNVYAIRQCSQINFCVYWELELMQTEVLLVVCEISTVVCII